ncbi:hypothetical protein K1719_018406 [Acacia pycnantha]|nr:hypothetical protein K1719_018406 [Acacia pycnantha]
MSETNRERQKRKEAENERVTGKTHGGEDDSDNDDSFMAHLQSESSESEDSLEDDYEIHGDTERVKKIVPCHYQFFHNDIDKENLTARELFYIEHSEMLKEAQEWIKGMAQSCSAVSVLVATMVFVTAYAVPSSTNVHDVPNLINSPLFLLHCHIF